VVKEVLIAEGKGTGLLGSELLENLGHGSSGSLFVARVSGSLPVGSAPRVATPDPLLGLAVNFEFVGANDLVSVTSDPGLLVSSEECQVMRFGPPHEVFPVFKTLFIGGGIALVTARNRFTGIITQVVHDLMVGATITDSVVVTVDLGPGLFGESRPHLSLDARVSVVGSPLFIP